MSQFWENKVAEEIDRRNKSAWSLEDQDDNPEPPQQRPENVRRREEAGLGDDAHIMAAPYRSSDRIIISGDADIDRWNIVEFVKQDKFSNIQQKLQSNIQQKLQDLSNIFEKSQKVLFRINRDLIEMQRIQQKKRCS